MKAKDEFRSCRRYDDNYTIKTYEREDCRFYSIVLYETENDSKVIYTSKSQPNATRAGNLAVEHIRKHKQLVVGRK